MRVAQVVNCSTYAAIITAKNHQQRQRSCKTVRLLGLWIVQERVYNASAFRRVLCRQPRPPVRRSDVSEQWR